MRIVETELWYAVIYKTSRGLKPVRKALVMHEGTAQAQILYAKDYEKKWYKEPKVLEVNLKDPSKSRYVKLWEKDVRGSDD